MEHYIAQKPLQLLSDLSPSILKSKERINNFFLFCVQSSNNSFFFSKCSTFYCHLGSFPSWNPALEFTVALKSMSLGNVWTPLCSCFLVPKTGIVHIWEESVTFYSASFHILTWGQYKRQLCTVIKGYYLVGSSKVARGMFGCKFL